LSGWSCLVGLAVALGTLELNLQSLHADLESIHGGDGSLGRHGCVVAHEPEALAEVGLLVDEDLGGDDVSEGHEHLHEILVAELLRQVVDEEVGAVRAF